MSKKKQRAPKNQPTINKGPKRSGTMLMKQLEQVDFKQLSDALRLVGLPDEFNPVDEIAGAIAWGSLQWVKQKEPAWFDVFMHTASAFASANEACRTASAA